MPVRMGELMVVVRAQDFASRTLRRVGAEMHGLSAQQAMQFRGQAVAFQKATALADVAARQSDLRRLNYVRSAKAIDQQVKALKRLQAADAAMRGPAGRFVTVTPAQTRELHNASRAVQNLGLSTANVGGQVSKLDQQYQRMLKRIDLMPASFRRAAESQAVWANSWVRANRNLQTAYNNLSRAEQAQLAFNQALRAMPLQRAHDIAAALGGIGRTLQLFGAVGTVSFGLAAREAATFSQSVSLAATQVTRIGAGTQEAIDNAAMLRERILELSKAYPFAAKEMAEATYEIFSSTNIQTIDQGMALLEAFARAGVAGQTDIETATKASITVLNTFKGSADDVTQTLNRMFAIVRFGRMRFQDFADMLPKVAAAAYGSGQSLDDVAGIMAFLTRKTGDAGIAATQISRAFDVFSRAEFRDGIKALGVDIEDVHGKLLPLPEVLGAIMDKWGAELKTGGRGAERFIQIVTRASQEAGKGFLSTAEARRFFRFVFAHFDEYSMLQKKVTTDNKEFRRSFETLMADPGVQWQIFIQRLRVLIIEIGQKAIPVFQDLGRVIANFLDRWDRLGESTQGTIIKWATLGSIAALLGGIIISLVGSVISLGITMGTVFWRVAKLGAAFLGLSNLIGKPGTVGLAARVFALVRMFSYLAAIGTIVIGIKLEQKGGGWDFVGKILKATGAAGLIRQFTRGRVPMKIGGPIAAFLDPLINPENAGAAEDNYNKYVAMLNDIDKRLKGTVNRKKAIDIERTAIMKFNAALKLPGGTLQSAQAAVSKYLKSVGVSLNDSAKDADTASEKWEAFLKRTNRLMQSAKGRGLLKAMGLDADSLAEMDQAWHDSLDTAKQRQNELLQVQKNAQEQAISNLQNMYMEMEQVNREAFGQLFQGPWLTSETFDLAKEWGIQPRIQDLIKDLHQQNAQFAKWRSDLDKLMKRGVPVGFIQELQKMGPEQGQPLLDQILSAKPGQVNKLIAEWKRREGQIKNATKMDFKDEIERFKTAGGDMGEAIINGFKGAEVGAWFQGWIKQTFPELINAAVNQAVAEWKQANPVQPTGAPGTGRGNNKAKPRAPQNTRAPASSQDNSRHANVNIYMGESAQTASQEAAVRKAAFTMSNVMRGLNWP